MIIWLLGIITRPVRDHRRTLGHAADVSVFLAGLGWHRDRAVVLAMVLGGLRAGEVRGLLLADVDQGRRQLRVVGKGGRERVVPVDGLFFAELAAYLARERAPGLATPECFVVLRAPAGRSPRRGCAVRSATTGSARARPGSARTGCATPTAPSSF